MSAPVIRAGQRGRPQGGPPPLVPALAYGALVIATAAVSAGRPRPGTSAAATLSYAQAHTGLLHVAAMLTFGAAMPLAIWAATIYRRLRTLGVTAPGAVIGLAGGILAAASLALSGLFHLGRGRYRGGRRAGPGPGGVRPRLRRGRGWLRRSLRAAHRGRGGSRARPAAHPAMAGLGWAGDRGGGCVVHADPADFGAGRDAADREVRRPDLDHRDQRPAARHPAPAAGPGRGARAGRRVRTRPGRDSVTAWQQPRSSRCSWPSRATSWWPGSAATGART